MKRAQEFQDAWEFYYNFLRPHKSVRDNPPAGDYWGNTSKIGAQYYYITREEGK